MSKEMHTEDEVRDSAKLVLGFDKTTEAKCVKLTKVSILLAEVR